MVLSGVIVPRPVLVKAIDTALARNPIVILTGPRQSGKTTLARGFVPEASINTFDLEDPTSLARLEAPMTALESLEGIVVLDEVQRRPDLFPVLRVLADRGDVNARFLILGSASGDLLRQSSESLAGRVERISIGGFTLPEVGLDGLTDLWLRGGFPRSFLATSEVDSVSWRQQFIQTLLERDLPQWGVRVPATALGRFWAMVAHYHGQTWNATEAARSLGVATSTSQRYLDLLTDALVIRQLRPWHANLKKRQVRSPKVYVRDSGLLHKLLGIDDQHALLHHPKLGASWEGFVIEQVLASVAHDDASFWATHQGAEIDLLLRRGDRLYGVECKRTDAPTVTRSIRTALDDLSLERVAVLYPGKRRYPLSDQVEAVPLAALTTPDTLFGT